MFKLSSVWYICLSIFCMFGCASNDKGAAISKDNPNQNCSTAGADPGPHGCGFPNKIRDGLAPAQYFRMAEVLLRDYDLVNAKVCLKKLRDNTSSPEAQEYADRLEKTAMPKYDIPEEAIVQLKEAEIAEKRGNIDKAKSAYNSLITKYPKFEWAYKGLADQYAYYRRDMKSADDLLQKALAINPNNVSVLLTCMGIAHNNQDHEKAYEYCMRIRAVDPTYSVYMLDWEIDNHNRATTLKNLVHRAAPRIVSERSQTTAASPPVNRTQNQTMPAEIRARINNNMREAMQLRRERSENFPPQIINTKGDIQIAFGPNIDTRGLFSNSLLRVNSDRRTQYWTTDGKQAFPKSFDAGMDFSEGLAAVKDGKWGYIDETGKFAIANVFDNAESFSEGLAAVQYDTGCGFVNKEGHVVIEPIYEKVYSFSNGLALVKLRDKIGYLDKSGHLVIPANFDSGRSFSDGLAEVGFLDKDKHELRLCYIDTSGKVRIDTSKIEVAAEAGDDEPSIYDLDDAKTVFGFKSSTGIGANRNLPRDFHCGLAGIKLGKKQGYINKEGRVAIKPSFRVAFDFSEDLASVQPGFGFDKGVIDKKGNIVIEPVYKEISKFQDGVAVVNKWEHSSNEALWGYINKKGEEILPLQYFEAAPFSDGLARVRPTAMSLASAKPAAAKPASIEEQTPASLPQSISHWAQASAKKISAAWPADIVCEVDKPTRFLFKLDQAGNAYDITFKAGCASPKTMLAVVHSVLFAMPFEKQDEGNKIVLDLTAENGKPKLKISNVQKSAPDANEVVLNQMPGKQKANSRGIVRAWMLDQLLFLCEKSAKSPDSPKIREALVKALKNYGLSPASAHDWQCVSRGNPPELALRKNPDDKDSRNCNAPLGALFQAWVLQKQSDTLHELEDAYRYKLALDLLQSNGEQPLYLGMAAELMDEYSEATKYYSKCDTTASFAKTLSAKFSNNAQAAPPFRSSTTAADNRNWPTAVKWLPTDSEVLITVLNPVKGKPVDSEKMVTTLFESLQSLAGAQTAANVQFALHAGRNSLAPTKIGVGKQAGANICVFAGAPGEESSFQKDVIVTVATEKLAGFDIVVKELSRMHSPSEMSFIARPFANVEIDASNRHYLRQLLNRINNHPADRAFPDNLPEWSAIDQKSDCWALRHYDKAYAPFDGSAPHTPIESEDGDDDNFGIIPEKTLIGFTFSGNRDGSFKANFLGTAPKTLKNCTSAWNHYPEINTGQFWGTGKGPQDYKMSPLKVTLSPDKKTATAAGKTTPVTAPMLNLLLLNQLGYMVAL